MNNMIEQIVKSPFPFYDYLFEEMNKDYINLVETNSEISGMKIVRNFHRSIFSSNIRNRKSPLSAWTDPIIMEKCLNNRIKYLGKVNLEILRDGLNISKLAPKVSVFKPALAKRLVNKYLNEFDQIFDPFSGFSGRLLGVASLEKNYIGQDLNQEAVKESNEIIRFLDLKNELIVQKDILDSKGRYEALFTCSPYSNKEIWGNETVFKSCDDWIDECKSRFICKKYLFVVDNTEKYKDFVVEEICNKSHFGTNIEKVILI
jgi:DNA modification methylase